jgi:hypothetical protein
MQNPTNPFIFGFVTNLGFYSVLAIGGSKPLGF